MVGSFFAAAPDKDCEVAELGRLGLPKIFGGREGKTPMCEAGMGVRRSGLDPHS